MTHRRLRLYFLLLTSVSFFVAISAAAQAPTSGAIEFSASVKPTAARPEPVRLMSFYLLRKSLADIHKEAEQAVPPADMDRFVDTTDVSPELKGWMKKHRTVQLSGADFTKLVTASDVVDIPEFLDAYTTQNGASLGGGVPIPSYKEKDREKNPEKYQRMREKYKQGLRLYITQNPDSIQGLDVQLRDKNPAPRWNLLEAQQRQRIERAAMELAQTRYLVARTDSDLSGGGVFNGLAPGTYWITTLDSPALAGDAHLRWDLTVGVRAGETTRLELSNLNAVESAGQTAR